jgi:hypothetical protein
MRGSDCKPSTLVDGSIHRIHRSRMALRGAQVHLRVEASLMKTVDISSARRVNFRCFVSWVSKSSKRG